MNEPLSLAERAKAFAEKKHAGTFRENKERQPFIVHPKEVEELVMLSGGSDKERAGAWIHDTVEDTDATLDEIEKLFGLEVRKIVDGLTDPPEFKGLPLLVRKTKQAERVQLKSDSVRRVKLADQIANVRSLLDPPVTWSNEKCRDYVYGANLVAMACKGVNGYLDSQFVLAYSEAQTTYIKRGSQPTALLIRSILKVDRCQISVVILPSLNYYAKIV